MSKRTPQSVEEAVRDVAVLERAIIAARRQVIRRHRLLGIPLVIWRDGQVVEIPPESIELPEENEETGENEP